MLRLHSRPNLVGMVARIDCSESCRVEGGRTSSQGISMTIQAVFLEEAAKCWRDLGSLTLGGSYLKLSQLVHVGTIRRSERDEVVLEAVSVVLGVPLFDNDVFK